MKILSTLLLFATAALAADPLSTCRDLDRHGKRAESKTCYEKLTGAHWSLQETKTPNEQFPRGTQGSTNEAL